MTQNGHRENIQLFHTDRKPDIQRYWLWYGEYRYNFSSQSRPFWGTEMHVYAIRWLKPPSALLWDPSQALQPPDHGWSKQWGHSVKI